MSEPGSSLSSAAESMRLMFIQRPTMSSRDIVDTFGFHGFEMVRELRARNIVEKCGGVEDDGSAVYRLRRARTQRHAASESPMTTALDDYERLASLLRIAMWCINESFGIINKRKALRTRAKLCEKARRSVDALRSKLEDPMFQEVREAREMPLIFYASHQTDAVLPELLRQAAHATGGIDGLLNEVAGTFDMSETTGNGGPF